MAFFVYILECLDGSYYTGYTDDVSKRILKHKSGKGSKYVRAKGFKELVYSEEFSSKELAMKREYFIKNSNRAYKEELVNYSSLSK
ncbi:GIY-YIG nuclease family protein [Candidatus Woesearchaeota archaeon]|jgi:putative endonuclease|nr:GIY-YIG nuclease family protein [Candidatus Woesearchaeota archaeon]MBT7237366.1 GIY-YIG nuclease family protein [Candidatus Woesearchaeota archaeon]